MAPCTLQSVCLSDEEMNQLCSGLTKGAQSIHISKCHPETHLLQLHGRSRHISVPLTDQDIRKPTSKQKPKNMQRTQKKQRHGFYSKIHPQAELLQFSKLATPDFVHRFRCCSVWLYVSPQRPEVPRSFN